MQVAIEIVGIAPLLDQGQHPGILDVLVRAAGEATAFDPRRLQQAPNDAEGVVTLTRSNVDP